MNLIVQTLTIFSSQTNTTKQLYKVSYFFLKLSINILSNNERYKHLKMALKYIGFFEVSREYVESDALLCIYAPSIKSLCLRVNKLNIVNFNL